MSESNHYVIIGTGPAGDEAARGIRRRDSAGQITMITTSKLPYIRRYQLYRVFEGETDWRQLLVHDPGEYERLGINLRRNTVVTEVDAKERIIHLRHREELHYDKLLVASGGGGYLPEHLSEFRHLVQRLSSFEDAQQTHEMLAEGGHVLMLGGDMMGIDLAGKLVGLGYRVTLVHGEHLFWPHYVSKEMRPEFLQALENMGLELRLESKVTRIEESQTGPKARRVVFDDGSDLAGDVVLSFCGLMPDLRFVSSTGLHIQRGLLVSPELATINEHIWAAGDVCQIWVQEENRYRNSYEWRSVKNMGRVAAINMTGGNESITDFKEGELNVGPDGQLRSPFWDYDQDDE